MGEPGKRAFFSNKRSGCRSCRNAKRKRAFCFRANWITRNFVIMTDQLKIETIARRRRTSLPAMVACSNAKTRPPAAINESISASPAELIAEFRRSERVSPRCDLFRKRRPQFSANDDSETERDQKERKELTARETGDQRGVRFAKILSYNPEDRVADEKQAGENSIRLPHARADQPKDCEEHDSFKESFVKLRRMSRRENPTENFLHLWLMTNRCDNCVRRIERRIDLSAGNDGALGLANVFRELFRKL